MKKVNNKERFHYCLPMEMVDWEFSGESKAHGMASAFSSPSYFKERCLFFTKKINTRIIKVVTNDDILKESLLKDVEAIESQIKAVSLKNNNDIEIIAYLFRLISHLLGWCFLDGETYRVPIYYQTAEQQAATLQKLSKLRHPLEIAYKKRKIIKQLLSEGVPYTQISLILGITVSNIKQLEKAEHIDKLYKTS